MKLTLSTEVNQSLKNVKDGFDDSLLKKLSPPFPKVTLKKFEGSKPGDIVTLELNFLVFKELWTSVITDEKDTSQEYYFVDEGVKLPTGLKFWRHKHLLEASNDKTKVIDIVEFKSWNQLTTLLAYPLMLLYFYYRKSIYKRIFG